MTENNKYGGLLSPRHLGPDQQQQRVIPETGTLATCSSAAPSASNDAVLSGATGDSSTCGRKRAEGAAAADEWSTTNETDLLALILLPATSRDAGLAVRSRDERLDFDTRRSPAGSTVSASRLRVPEEEVDDDDADDDEDGETAESESGLVGEDNCADEGGASSRGNTS